MKVSQIETCHCLVIVDTSTNSDMAPIEKKVGKNTVS